MAESGSNGIVHNLVAGAGEAPPADSIIKRALQVIRSHLGMEVAYVSEFVDNFSVFREVDAPGFESLIKVGDRLSLDDVYCRHILAGRMPQIIPDTSKDPIAATLPITKTVPIGKHMSVPIRLPDGTAYGMFCCLGFTADRSLHERDLQMMKAFAELASFEISRDVETEKAVKGTRARVKNAIEDDEISIAYQPIWKLEPRRIVGLECLARFSAAPQFSPDRWFADATKIGLGVELELASIRKALATLSSFPPDIYLAVNASPATLLSDELLAILDGMPTTRIVLEVTEHALVEDYDRLRTALEPLRTLGVRVAVDDAGAGYASLQHILHLQPDLIKLDMSLTRHVDLDPARRALASALIGFARETGSRLIAEGVETASELATLRALGVEKTQGYFLNRPMTLDRAVKLIDAEANSTYRVA